MGSALLAVVAVAAVAGSGTAGTSAALSAQALMGERVSGPWPMEAFAPRPGARAPSHTFAGRLVLGAELPGDQFRVLRDRFGDAKTNGGAARHLPPFDFAFVQSGDVLIPLERGPVRAAHPEWEFVVEPGHAWDQDGDGGLTRAAIPFALQERNANCLHNGVLTFLFGGNGHVSNVAYEIGKETCAYFHFDAWGMVRARYFPESLPQAAAAITAYGLERATRVPTRPVAQLAQDHPGVDPTQFGSPAEVVPADMTLYGVVLDGTHYTGGCDTRLGRYPYCDELDLPSYSLAKTLVGGLALMRAARLEPDVVGLRVSPLVPECPAATWADVTLGNLLDMASGHYTSELNQHDENSADMGAFFLAEDHAARVRYACEHYPLKTAPGSTWVYHTTDAYLLGTAVAAWYRGRAGAAADFYQDLLVDPIWRALDLSPAAAVSRRTRDSSNQPFTGYGLTLLRDDVVKLALFLSAGHGAIGSQQLIDPSMLRAALQQDPTQPGLPAGATALRYKNGMWAWDAQAVLGCSGPTWIPFLSGYGGIIVALFPNGIIYYYFSDGGVHAWARAAREADRIRPFCRKAT